MTKVAEIMSSPAVTVREDMPIREVARVMLEHNIGGVPVVDDDQKLVGMISESDFTGKEAGLPFSYYSAPQVFGKWFSDQEFEQVLSQSRFMKAKDIMSEAVVVATEDEPVGEVVKCMIQQNLTRIPVVRNGAPIGMIARRDLLQLIAKQPEPADANLT